jgi:hypothetical protein
VPVKISLFENRVLRGVLGAKKDEGTGIGEDRIMKRLMVCTAHQILFG